MVRISESEYEVMKVIWEKKEATSLEIIESLVDKNWNKNTIRTFLSRLIKKEAVKMIKREGQVNVYMSLLDENEYRLYATKRYIKQMYNGSFNKFIMEYIDDENVDEILEILNKAIQHKRCIH